jgi:diphthamide synthase (EF-2-diphthine--ammonia ligase)
MLKPKAVMNWSGGKDSALALHKVLQANEFEVTHLLTTVNRHWQRISMHGVRRKLLYRQAKAIGIKLIEVFLPEAPSMEIYEAELNKALDFLIERGVTHAVIFFSKICANIAKNS